MSSKPKMPNSPHHRKGMLFVISSHFLGFKVALKQIIKKPFLSLFTTAMIATTLALPALLYLLTNNLDKVTSQWNTEPTISIFLKKEASAEQIRTLMQLLHLKKEVAKINYISPEQGLNDLKKFSEFSSLTSLLTNNPLPGVINITLSSQNHDFNALQSLLGVMRSSLIVDKSQLDTSWLQRIGFILTLSKRVTFVISLLLSAIVILVISYNIFITTKSRQHEIQLLKFLGATKTYIRRPFLYHGLLTGLLGGVLAWILTLCISFVINPPVLLLIRTYNSHFQTNYHALASLVVLITISTILGLTAAWITTKQQLNNGGALTH